MRFWENQRLPKIDDQQDLQLSVRVHESKIARVQAGQKAVIRIDAFPQRDLAGRVEEVSRTPTTANWPDVDRKDYAVTVSIKDPPESIRLGLTALVEIEALVQPKQ